MADKVVSLKISDYTSLNNAVSTEEGEKVNQYIREALKRADIVELDFSGIVLLTTAFLNGAIGQLYSTYSSEELGRKLRLVHVDKEDLPRFKKVIERAKVFYREPEMYNDVVNNVLDGTK